MDSKDLEEPNDLLRLCYEYKLQKIPIERDGTITGAVSKSDLVRYLSRSEHFEEGIPETINHLVESVDDGFLPELKQELRSGAITGIPVVGASGTVSKTITPGVLKAERDSEEFLERSDQLEFYETLLEEVPFPVTVESGDGVVFENSAHGTGDREGEWVEKKFESGEFTVRLALPQLLDDAFGAFESLREGNAIDIREILDKIEVGFLKKAHRLNDSISDAAEQIGLPRQTFNYRWDNKVDSSQDS